MKISKIKARQIFDSRGNPTIEADVILENNIVGRAAVPSGASTGANEALELRDGENGYLGKSVFKAVENVNSKINNLLQGVNVEDQADLDKKMIDFDATENKANLGANAILAVSLAASKAAAKKLNKSYFEYIHDISGNKQPVSLPLPMMNIINGGAHASFSTDIQEFMIICKGAVSFTNALKMGSEVFHNLSKVLKQNGYPTTVGDEGGYAPIVKNGNKEALDLISKAIENAGYKLGVDIVLGLDVAASEFYKDGKYLLKTENKSFTTEEMIDWLSNLVSNYPIVSIEDGLSESDWDGWVKLNSKLGSKIQLVGDDLLVTNTKFLQKAIAENAANAILIKVNQIGTLTETINAVNMAKDVNWASIISHRSGETEDVSISHLAVGLSTGQIKTGSLSRTDRIAKYNELLRIEEELGDRAIFNTNIFKI